VLHPKTLHIGIGCRRGAKAPAIAGLIRDALERLELSPLAIAGIASADVKRFEPGLLDAAALLGVPVRFFSLGELDAVPVTSVSPKAREIFGVNGVCEPAALLAAGEAGFLHTVHAAGEGFHVEIVAGGPELFRNDRRLLYIFANGRRIQDFGLSQAFEYGMQGLFPNGTHPVGAAFVDIDPKLADFNIHPAKREVRFSDSGAIHHAISSSLKNFSRQLGLSRSVAYNGDDPAAAGWARDFEGGLYDAGAGGCGGATRSMAYNGAYSPAGPGPRAAYTEAGFGGSLALEALLEKPPAFAPLPCRTLPGRAVPGEDAGYAAEEAPPYGEPRYAGRAFGLFILVEWGEKLFIIDQHAAHERILYNRFLSRPIPKQELLVPIPFTTGSDEEDRFLLAKKEELEKLAVVFGRDGTGWRIEALPAGWRAGDAETVKEILELREAGENMAERWAATLCCHAAVRDGDQLDDESAFTLAKEALALPDPRCPHGRPVWTELSREALYKAVRRE
jgi:DNA mismatch repair protein MutL